MTAGEHRDPEWLVLVHQVPSQPPRGRVRTWRRLQRLGALGLKNAVYVLPNSAQAREDFEWMRSEIEALGGGATVFEADTIDAASRGEIVTGFRDARRDGYREIQVEAERLLRRARRGGRSDRPRVERALRALRDRLDEVQTIDFFDAPGGDEAAAALAALDRAMEGDMKPDKEKPEAARLRTEDFRGRRWLTRPRPAVDRMSSAWLIRRFVDPRARFAFSDRLEGDSIPFDMYGVEFGHHGSDCTFETLLRRFGIEDPAALWIGRIVHDLDLKEERYGEPETAAIGRLVAGLRQMHEDDAELLERGIEMFEALYRSFEATPARKRGGGRSRSAAPGRSRRRPRGGSRTRKG